ncbi:MAG: hypothetical protein R2848_01185 [Thermomicrobiales bacterium]
MLPVAAATGDATGDASCASVALTVPTVSMQTRAIAASRRLRTIVIAFEPSLSASS